MELRHVIAVITVMVFIYLFEYVFNAYLLIDYAQQAQAIGKLGPIPYSIGELSQVLLAVSITGMFVYHCKDCTLQNGVVFGLCLGVIMGLSRLSAYPYMSVKFDAVALWFFAAVIEGLGAAIMLTETYKGSAKGGKKTAKKKK